ncbi:MAG: site-specific DNA-methyltransferase [Anaerolineales bacterium]|nr:site-specific DNA-methyltransferase [Anaerolineales bacterium]
MNKHKSIPVAVPSLTKDRLAELTNIFPEAFSEGKVDFEKLRATLGDLVGDRPERYSFSWAGKRDAIRLLQTPTRATLVPAPEESVDFDTTRNVFIEGENLEVLKLLYKPYFGRVKMIYIDPPYNTGNDFIYPDDYRDPLGKYLELTGQRDNEGNLLTSNPETSGRYHSAWLSMMYPRLFLARQLLREDGVIFVSIDDNEVYNLRILMNEIFGEENFIGQLIWKRRQTVDSRAKTGLSEDHEYVVVFGKGGETKLRGQLIDLSKFSNPDNDPRGDWWSADLTGLATKDQRPNLHYELVNPETGITYPCPENGWRYSIETMDKLIAEKRILWPATPDGRPRLKRFRSDREDDYTNLSSVLNTVYTTQGTRALKELFDGQDVLDFPKPVELIRLLIEQITNLDDVILDFFAGSATTAQAVFDLNRLDGGNRKFILVQLPEPTGNQDFSTISDIGKERISRVIARIHATQDNLNQMKLPLDSDQIPEDLGFRVYKLAPSHFKPWVGVEEKGAQAYAQQMELFRDPLVEGWTDEGVLTELAIKHGFSLSAQFEALEGVEKLYRVSDLEKEQSFLVCLASRISLEDVAALNLQKEDLFICRDAALDDETAANLALQCQLETI